MTTDRTRVGEQRPGGRSARVRESILTATFELLAEVGYEHLSIEDVADRAGVHKTTVYRRWPAKADLVLEAALAFSEETIPIPDTGSLLGDLTALGRGVVANLTSDAGARRSLSLVAATASSGELAESMHRFWAVRMDRSAAIVTRAIERGEIAVGTDPNLVVEAVVAPLWIRLLLTGEPIEDGLADRLAALVTGGLAAG